MSNDNQPNILFIVMDTARAQTILQNKEVMPNFHQVAEEGTLFTRAFSTAPWTLPSHASMFTGQYTSDHGTHAGSKFFDPSTQTLAEILRDTGYETIAFSNNVWISSQFGFNRGYETMQTSLELVDGGSDLASIAKECNGPAEQSREVVKALLRRNGHRTLINAIYSKFFRGKYDDGARLTNWRIKRWISNSWDGSQPFFMFANYLEPHLEYDPPEEFKYQFTPEELSHTDLDTVNQDAWAYVCDQVEMNEYDFNALEALYRAELNYLDHRLGNLFEFLADERLLDETMVVIVGDHGENIGDHNLMDHQYSLHNTLLHVPLLVRYPDEFPEGKQCDELVELRDVFPTLLSTVGIEYLKNETVSSQSLQQTLDTGGRDHTFAEYVVPQPSMDALEGRVGTVPNKVKQYDRALRSIQGDEWKLIYGSDGLKRLFEMSTGVRETTDVSNVNRSVVEKRKAKIQDQFGQFSNLTTREQNNVDASTEARLEDLGYL